MPPADQHYFAGFVLRPEDGRSGGGSSRRRNGARARRRGDLRLGAAAGDARRLRLFRTQEDEWTRSTTCCSRSRWGARPRWRPRFSTAIVTSAAGTKRATPNWAEARTRYDVGPGVRSEADIADAARLLSRADGAGAGVPAARSVRCSGGTDEALGVGDGVATRFAAGAALWRGGAADHAAGGGSVWVAVDGLATADFTLGDGGMVDARRGAG